MRPLKSSLNDVEQVEVHCPNPRASLAVYSHLHQQAAASIVNQLGLTNRRVCVGLSRPQAPCSAVLSQADTRSDAYVLSIHLTISAFILLLLGGCAMHAQPQIRRYLTTPTDWTAPAKYRDCQVRAVELENRRLAMRLSCPYELVFLDKESKRVLWEGDAW